MTDPVIILGPYLPGDRLEVVCAVKDEPDIDEENWIICALTGAMPSGHEDTLLCAVRKDHIDQLPKTSVKRLAWPTERDLAKYEQWIAHAMMMD